MSLRISDCFPTITEGLAAIIGEGEVNDLHALVYGISNRCSPGLVVQRVLLCLKGTQWQDLSLRRKTDHTGCVPRAMAVAGNDAGHDRSVPELVFLGITSSGKVLTLEDLPS